MSTMAGEAAGTAASTKPQRRAIRSSWFRLGFISRETGWRASLWNANAKAFCREVGSVQVLMTTALVVVAGAVVLMATFLWRTRGQVSDEAAMIGVMSVTMVAGMTAGTLAGLLLPEDLWPPTAIGAAAGVVAGVVMGARSGLMVMLEGLTGGLMGGTMGAMMGGMMPARGVPLLSGGTILTASITALALAVLTRGQGGEHNRGHGPHALALKGAMIAGAAVAVVVGVPAWFGFGPLVHRLPSEEAHQHVNPLKITVTAREFGFSAERVVLPLGRPVHLLLVNDGRLEHDLTAPRLEYRLAARRDRRAEPPGLHLFAAPGSAESLEFIPLRAGEFEVYCSVAGHREQGMRLVLRVTASGETESATEGS